MQHDNVTIARRFVEGVLGGQNPAAFDEIVDENIRVSTGLKPDADIRGKKDYLTILTKFGSAFTNGRLTITDIFASADGDRVVVMFEAYATHTGEMFGVSSTGIEVPMIETHVMRFHNGKLMRTLSAATIRLASRCYLLMRFARWFCQRFTVLLSCKRLCFHLSKNIERRFTETSLPKRPDDFILQTGA